MIWVLAVLVAEIRFYIGTFVCLTDAEYEVSKELMLLISTLYNYFIPKVMLQKKDNPITEKLDRV
ncbi:MAG: hypothetical protein ABIL74_02665 [candidate division WOR-3 bacterium]